MSFEYGISRAAASSVVRRGTSGKSYITAHASLGLYTLLVTTGCGVANRLVSVGVITTSGAQGELTCMTRRTIDHPAATTVRTKTAVACTPRTLSDQRQGQATLPRLGSPCDRRLFLANPVPGSNTRTLRGC